MLKFLTVVSVLLATLTAAEARQKRFAAHPDCNVVFPCEGVAPSARGERIAKAVGFGAAIKYYTPRAERREARRIVRVARRAAPVRTESVSRGVASPQAQMLPHPEGCPRSLFCGCGAAVELFGKPVRYLWLAANWFGFPSTSPAPNMVGVRRHHVFVLKQHVGGDRWLVADYNSGGRRSRLHVRSISGYSIRNPHGG